MLCCCEKPAEKKLTKPLLAESKSISGESKAYTGEPKAPERKLTEFESLPSPKLFVAPRPEPAQMPIVVKSEPKPEPVPEPEPEPVSEPEPLAVPIVSAPILIPTKTLQTVQAVPQEEIASTFIEKSIRNEKKNRKSNRR
jgi:protein TonB